MAKKVYSNITSCYLEDARKMLNEANKLQQALGEYQKEYQELFWGNDWCLEYSDGSSTCDFDKHGELHPHDSLNNALYQAIDALEHFAGQLYFKVKLFDKN